MARPCIVGALDGFLVSLFVCCAVGSASGQLSLFARQDPAGTHDLWAVDDLGLTVSIAKDGLTFLPVALRGVPRRDRLRSDLARQIEGPAPAVRLPALGSLYRVARLGGTSWLHAASDGSSARLAETPDDAGPGLSAAISVDPAGQRALVCSPFDAGGEVRLLALDSDSELLLTATLPALTVDDASLRLGPDMAWFIADGQLYRADLLAGTPPTPAALPLGPSDFDLPGYEAGEGPLLVLSNDGGRAAWRRTVLVKELFSYTTGLPNSTVQVTADAAFTDTIDIVGVLGFIGPTLLSFVAGEVPGPLEPDIAIGSADLYTTDLSSGLTSNVTVTSGELFAPFLIPGELEIMEALVDPKGERLLLQIDPQNGDFGLSVAPLDGSSGLTTLLAAVEGPPTLTAVGERVLIASTLDPQAGGGVSPTQVHLLDSQNGPAPFTFLGSAAGGLVFDRFSFSRDAASIAFAVGLSPAFELIVWVDTNTATANFAWLDILALSPALGFSSSGQLLAGLGMAGGPYLFAGFDAPLSGAVQPVPVGIGFPLNP